MEAPSDGTVLRAFQGAGKPLTLPSRPEGGRDAASVPAEVDEDLWRELMTPQRERWATRSKQRDLTPSQREYAARRTRRLEAPYAAAPFACERSYSVVRCGCGPRPRMHTCRQHLVCRRCAKARSRKQSARIRKGLEAAIAATRRNIRPIMLTLTIRHSGDVGLDRKRLADAWKRFRKAYHRRWGAFAFVGVYEVTAGEDGLGHAHAHVVAMWPWRPWGQIRAMWIASVEAIRVVNVGAMLPTAPRAVSVGVRKPESIGSGTMPVLRASVGGSM